MYENLMGFTPFLTATMNGNEQSFKILLNKIIDCFKTNYFNHDQILSLFISEKPEKKNVDHSNNDSK